MKYQSTRGLEKGVSFKDVLFAGYSKDGGLYFPERVPKLSQEQLESWSKLSYPDLLTEILCLYIDPSELSREQIIDLATGSFSRFEVPEVMRVAELKNDLRVSELFHGPTLAFKDLGLGVVARLLETFLSASGERCLIVVATSGDTGSAAIQAVRGLDNIDIVVLLPHGRCTEIQELQMTTCIDDNVHVFAADGNSDEIDVEVKSIFADTEFVKRHRVISSNSINWARVLSQMTHFFYGYFRTCAKVGDVVEMVLPTGAAGNITAGCVAARMGLPVRLVAAVNTNDIVYRSLSSGDFSKADEVVVSLAPAMDIQVPYSMERLMLLFSDHNTELVKTMMTEFEANGRVQIDAQVLKEMQKVIVDAQVVPDDAISSTLTRCWEENQYTLCPHTATAAHYHYSHVRPDGPRRLCVATAGPDKFPEALQGAGVPFQPCERIRQLHSMPTRSEPMERGQDWEAMLRQKIEAVSAVREAGGL
ncbi:threonine synthase-like 2 [Amphibalanus amphitrite]|uniref:threonine synthase-like 2 n=1 Tax=Amphibalanus amphitrite TaxID=1232801 RepID=UPI001C910E97|nr:threonine synthase-like 2 [Amphibalanus amphitrite]